MRSMTGIAFGFSENDWTAIATLLQRAWAQPEVLRLWDALTLEYGDR